MWSADSSAPSLATRLSACCIMLGLQSNSENTTDVQNPACSLPVSVMPTPPASKFRTITFVSSSVWNESTDACLASCESEPVKLTGLNYFNPSIKALTSSLVNFFDAISFSKEDFLSKKCNRLKQISYLKSKQMIDKNLYKNEI